MNTVRQVAIEGGANGTVIVTGDGNQISLSANEEFAYHPLDEAFRTQQRQSAPADFYNGTRPNWANIALEHDSPRHLIDDIIKFTSDPSPPAQRIGIITGLSGEGKTTLLMRAAWELSLAGHPVLWRHKGHVLWNYHLPLTGGQRLVICFDEMANEENLPDLVSDLVESGLPFVILGSARKHDWENCEFRSTLQRQASLREFKLDRLQEGEVQDLLTRLERANALGALASFTPERRMSHFLDRLEADGQLLPALLTARRGKSFDQILESVFEDLSKRHDKETIKLLLHGYAGIALVHRFNFGMTRPLLARFVGIGEEELTPHLLHPLEGELLEISTGEEQQLSTRHPWIAEKALGFLCGPYVPEETYLYKDLYRALGELLQSDPLSDERKLLSQLPLAFKRKEQIDKARQIFKLAAVAAPNKARTLQPWAMMESKLHNYEGARELFQQASEADPEHAPVYHAWAMMEKKQRNYERARELFQKAADANPNDPVTFQAWAIMEKERQDFVRARELFKLAADADPNNASSYQAWAIMESRLGGHEIAQKILERGLQCVSKRRGMALLLSTMGSLLARQEDYEEARRYFTEALSFDDKDSLTHYHFAVDCLLPDGKKDMACQHLRRALKLRVRKKYDRRKIERALEQHCDHQF